MENCTNYIPAEKETAEIIWHNNENEPVRS